MSHFTEKGCLFLKNVYTNDIIDMINLEINNFIRNNNIMEHLNKKIDVAEETFYVNNTYSMLNSFEKMFYYYLPVIDNRGTHDRSIDVGVYDFFHIEKLMPNIIPLVDMFMLVEILKKISGSNWKFFRANLQFHTNVSNPQSFHIDNVDKETVKICIYLTDISENESGPPMYIEGTHIDKKNFKQKDVKTFLGKKGDILISMSNGFHRKMPQTKHSIHGFLVFHFVKI